MKTVCSLQSAVGNEQPTGMMKAGYILCILANCLLPIANSFGQVNLINTGIDIAITGTCNVYVDGHVTNNATGFIHNTGNICLTGQFANGKTPVRIVVRATDVTLALGKPKDISARTMLKGMISKCEFDGSPIAIIHVKLEGGEELAAALTRKAIDQLGLDEGQAVWCLLKSVSIDERWIALS